MEKVRYNELGGVILDSAIKVHKAMGPGLLESIYQECLTKELVSRSISVKVQSVVPLVYRGELLTKEIYSRLAC